MASPVRALVFDAYGTLFDPLAVKTRAEELFPGNGGALSHLWRAKQLEYSWLRTLMGRYENFWKITEDALIFACRSLKLSSDNRQRQQLMQVYLTLPAFPDVKPALENLSRLPLSILSNGTPEMLASVVAANNMTRAFQSVFSVDALKMYKPRAEVYQHAVAGLGVPKEAVGFVSSNYWDIAGATSFGFRTYWLNRNALIADELGITPTAILPNISSLPALLNTPDVA
jgi:2-haloacid dehalogenase